jgi:hypothetical protein
MNREVMGFEIKKKSLENLQGKCDVVLVEKT